jgi:hypothetical protein
MDLQLTTIRVVKAAVLKPGDLPTLLCSFRTLAERRSGRPGSEFFSKPADCLFLFVKVREE